MILDRASDLKVLAAQAAATASATTEAVSYEAIANQIDHAGLMLGGCGIIRLLAEVPETHRLQVRASAADLLKVLNALAAAPDAELAALASGAADKRGSVTSVGRLASSLRGQLLDAQTALLSAWAVGICPVDDVAKLELRSHLPAGQGASHALTVRARIAAAAEEGTALSVSQLEAHASDARTTMSEAQGVATSDVPDDVVAFWRAASGFDGAPLDELSESVLQWLRDHGALSSFYVRRDS